MAQDTTTSTSKTALVVIWASVGGLADYALINFVPSSTQFLHKSATGEKIYFWLQTAALGEVIIAIIIICSLVPKVFTKFGGIRLHKFKLFGAEVELKYKEPETENEEDEAN